MKAGWFLSLCCLVLPASGQSAPQNSQPDVFLVTIDTLRADHVHCYGDQQIETPALDSLAKDGVRFAQAFTPSPITNTSHTSILTGLLPSSHGVTDFGVPLAPSHPTLAELLKPQGYSTAAFIGAVILDSKVLAPGLDRGFDFYDNFPEHVNTKSRWGRVERRGMEVVQHAEHWFSAHPAGPRFVWVHLYDPHDPYEPPPPYSERYKDRLYDGEIAYADSALGNLVAFLKTQGRYDRALLIVVGDHGEGLGEHGENTHGIFLYDSTTHVPLIVKLPGFQAAGKEVSEQVRTTDILPTVLDLLGVQAPERLDGESLKSYVASASGLDRVAFGETDYPMLFGWAPLRSVRDGGFKLIEAPRPELYDLRSDPKELQNIYGSANLTVPGLRGKLADLGAKKPAENQAPAGAASLPDPKDKIQEQNLLHVAMLATDDERPDDARAALETVLQMDAKSPIALRQLGQLELESKNYARAADYLRRAVEVRPDNAAAAFDYGRALNFAGNLSAARDALLASLKLNPSQFAARLLLSQIYLRLKDPASADDQLEAALLLQPNSVEVQLGLARVSISQRKFAEAEKCLAPLARSQPTNPEVYELLAEVYSGLGKAQESKSATAHAKRLRLQERGKLVQ